MKKQKNHDRAPDKVQTSIAIPKVLMSKIEQVAAAETRNRNNTIQWLLENAIKDIEASSGIVFMNEDKDGAKQGLSANRQDLIAAEDQATYKKPNRISKKEDEEPPQTNQQRAVNQLESELLDKANRDD